MQMRLIDAVAALLQEELPGHNIAQSDYHESVYQVYLGNKRLGAFWTHKDLIVWVYNGSPKQHIALLADPACIEQLAAMVCNEEE